MASDAQLTERQQRGRERIRDFLRGLREGFEVAGTEVHPSWSHCVSALKKCNDDELESVIERFGAYMRLIGLEVLHIEKEGN